MIHCMLQYLQVGKQKLRFMLLPYSKFLKHVAYFADRKDDKETFMQAVFATIILILQSTAWNTKISYKLTYIFSEEQCHRHAETDLLANMSCRFGTVTDLSRIDHLRNSLLSDRVGGCRQQNRQQCLCHCCSRLLPHTTDCVSLHTLVIQVRWWI